MEPVEHNIDPEALIWPLVLKLSEEINFASNSLEKAILYDAVQEVTGFLWDAIERVPILVKYLTNPQLGTSTSMIRQLQANIVRTINDFVNLPWLSEEQEQVVIERVVAIILGCLVEGKSILSVLGIKEG